MGEEEKDVLVPVVCGKRMAKDIYVKFDRVRDAPERLLVEGPRRAATEATAAALNWVAVAMDIVEGKWGARRLKRRARVRVWS